jgi:hypothetical protein
VCRHNDNEVWLFIWYCSTECTLQL